MSDIANRVAAKYLKAQGDEDAAAACAEADVSSEQETSSEHDVSKIPFSKPGQQMFRKLVKDLETALDKEDHNGFREALERLNKAHEQTN